MLLQFISLSFPSVLHVDKLQEHPHLLSLNCWAAFLSNCLILSASRFLLFCMLTNCRSIHTCNKHTDKQDTNLVVEVLARPWDQSNPWCSEAASLTMNTYKHKSAVTTLVNGNITHQTVDRVLKADLLSAYSHILASFPTT